jgi:PAS domain S-box-containing protein
MATKSPEPVDEANDFEEEKTSPEVVRAPRAQRGNDEGHNPIAVVALFDAQRRRKLVELMWTDGWNAVEAKDADELLEICRTLAPSVAIIAAGMITKDGSPLVEAIRSARPDAAMRTVGLLDGQGSANIAAALADGFDDFVSTPDNDVEVLARATANLRAARNLGEIHKQRRDAALLLELSQTLASSLDMQLILHTVSRLIAEVIALERCSIVLLDPDRDDAVMVAASEDRAVKDLRIRLSNYPELKRCVESAAPVLIEDAQSEPLLSGVHKNIVDKNVRTMALFPIVFEERVTGVLFLRSSKPARRLTESEIQFGQTVASACAVAIRNARLFDQFKDQTERINSMRMLAERQTEALKKYQDFFEYAADGMAIIDAEGRVLYVNKEGRRLLGRTRDDLLQLKFQDLLLEESRGRWSDVVDQVRHGRFKRSFDVYVGRGDGNERVFSLSAGGGGQETGLLIVSFRDVTETREMEGELRTTKEFLENLIDNSVDAIVAADMNGNIMLFNKGAEKIYGYKAEDVIGRMHVSQLYPPGVGHDVMRRLRDERWGGRGRLEAHRREIVTYVGEIVPCSMTASIIYEDGEEVATVGVFTDLRERMAVERQLNEAKDLLSKTEKARVAAELAGMAAHELNQPLTSVLGYAEMLRNRVPETDERLRRPIDTIFRQAERMAEIVRKIGRITKYETRRYGLNVDIIDIDRASVDADDDTGDRTFDEPMKVTSPGGAPVPSNASGLPEPDDTVTLPPQHARAEHTPASGNPRSPGPSKEEKKDPSVVMALASMPGSRPGPAPAAGADPRAAIVRMDTVDEEPAGYERRLREREKKLAQQQQQAQHGTAAQTPPKISQHDDEGQTQRFVQSPRPPGDAPLPKSLAVNVPDVKDTDEHTNPGVRFQDMKKK